ncbi:hypothetical protein GC197_06375 [bacterium]|nr:hypothetical protein [bacterium]
MPLSPARFWNWFRGFADRLPVDEIPDTLQDELLSQLHGYDDRLYFLLSTDSTPRELIVTANGVLAAFEAADALVSAAPDLSGWKFHSLKPPMGFDFRHTDGPISLDVSQLWFVPLTTPQHPAALGVVIGLPDADFVYQHESVDTAYTIISTAIGERECAQEIAHFALTKLPDSPEENGYLELPRLPDYIEFHKRQNG